MFKNFFKSVHNLEEMLVDCAEMCHFTNGISKLLMDKNKAYLKEKENKDKQMINDFSQCEMYRYLSAM